jgi:hypothetical protein
MAEDLPLPDKKNPNARIFVPDGLRIRMKKNCLISARLPIQFLPVCSQQTVIMNLSLNIACFVILVIFGLVFQTYAADLYHPQKLYYAVFYMGTQKGDWVYRIEYSQYFTNGKDAHYAEIPDGYKEYTAWCWKDGSGNCDAQILEHGIRSFCKTSGCRIGKKPL